MIIKKVTAKKTGAAKSKALHVRDLCDYIAGPDAGDEREKVEHRGSVNLLNLDHAAQVQEIADLAEAATRSPQPVQHWIMSWRQGEQPTGAQADRAVAIFLEEMGLSGHQAIYALHRDTDNWHLHVAVNRVHPETERVVTVNNGFDLEVAHRAIARIEHEQGWHRERGGRYQVRETGVERTPMEVRAREPATRARDFENLTGERSAQRIAIENGAEVIRAARTWRELHASLAERGMRFEKKGSGAILWVGETAVKASTAARDCSMSALEKRLGAFEPAPMSLEPNRTAPEPVSPAAPGWHDYIAARQEHYAGKKQERELLGRRKGDEWRAMTERQQVRRQKLLRGNWRGRGAALNAVRSVLAAEQAKEKAALRERQQQERARLREAYPRWPGFEEWLRGQKPELADRWRFRDRTPAVVMGDAPDPARPRDIRSFTADAHGWQVHYRRIGSPGGGPSFTDQGRRVLIHDLSRESVLAALQLSAQKWGKFEVTGSAGYMRLCVDLAAEHSFRIANPALQEAIAAERERRHERVRLGGRVPPGRSPATPPPTAPSRAPTTDMAQTYERHFEEVAKLPGRADLSRVDALVAVRLRATGHGREQVELAIREGAARRRPHERRDWPEYARRAAEHAFGVSGERERGKVARDLDRLLALEGRAREPSRSRGRDLDLGR